MPKVFIVPAFVGRKKFPDEAAEFYPNCVGPGWQKILLELTDKLFFLGWDGGLEQVKEKYGTLCFYWRNNIEDPMMSDIAEDLVSYAEHKTSRTCENCGEPGKLRGTGWLKTKCDKCWSEHEAKRAAENAKYEAAKSGK